MKLFKTAFILILTVGLGFGQTDCRPLIPTEKGTKWVLSNYSAKGKLTGTSHYEILDKVVSGDDITFKVQVTSYDKKEKEIANTTYEAWCKNGVFEVDMSVMLNGDSMQSFKDMDIEVDASNYELPDLSASSGTSLADGSLKVSVAATGLGLGMTINVTDRSVEGKESIKTPAGEFDCIVITQTVSTKMMINVKGSSKEWYAENIGLVRSESYNKKGKLLGYSELSKLEL